MRWLALAWCVGCLGGTALAAPLGTRALALPAPCAVENAGAHLECGLEPRTGWAPPVAAHVEPELSVFELHNRQVQHDLILFLPPEAGTLAYQRGLDQRRLLQPSVGGATATLNGLGLFMSATVASAHAPAPLRRFFDGPVHVGPSIFDDGMGVGISGSVF